MKSQLAAVLAAALATALVEAPRSYAQVKPSATQFAASAIGWDQVPSPTQLASIYSARERGAHTTGRSKIRCALQPDGKLKDCAVMAEDPGDAGFGWAAISAAKLYQAHLTDQLQRAIASAGVSIVLSFDWMPPAGS